MPGIVEVVVKLRNVPLITVANPLLHFPFGFGGCYLMLGGHQSCTSYIMRSSAVSIQLGNQQPVSSDIKSASLATSKEELRRADARTDDDDSSWTGFCTMEITLLCHLQ